jgi:NADP-dependent 3-hydroxy acid dehydrogenase YdfG
MTRGRPTALITGASRGIGAAIANVLGETHYIVLGGRDHRALADLAHSLPSAVPWPVELTDFDGMASAVKDFDRLDVLVHSAGVWEPGLIGDTALETWRSIFDVNVFAVAELTRLLLPALRAARGRVVLVNSTAGKRTSPARGAYTASKFALRALGDTLFAEEKENGVGVTTIYPARVATDMQRKVRDAEHGSFHEEDYIAPASIAHAVLAAIRAPSDSNMTEIVVAGGTGEVAAR